MRRRALLGAPAAQGAVEGALRGVAARATESARVMEPARVTGRAAARQAPVVRGIPLASAVALGAQGREGHEGPDNLIHIYVSWYLGTLHIMNQMTIPTHPERRPPTLIAWNVKSESKSAPSTPSHVISC